jgi:hypothetical protein
MGSSANRQGLLVSSIYRILSGRRYVFVKPLLEFLNLTTTAMHF